MNIEEKIQLIEEGTLEVIDSEELKKNSFRTCGNCTKTQNPAEVRF